MSDRPYQNYEHLIATLKSRGLEIPDKDYAIEVLKTRSYYGLINAFKQSLTTRDSNQHEHFKSGTNFNDLVFQYYVENELKSILLKYSLLAEIRFKESVGHQLGSQYGENINNWLRLTNFNNRTGKRSSFVQHFKKVSRETKNNPTKYYRDNHDAIPPWILLPNLTIGEFKNLYSILNPSDREPVVESILYLSGQASQLQISYVSNALSVLWHFRNSLAHGSRLIDFHSRTSISLMQTQSVYGLSFLSQDEYQQKKIGANDLFCFIAVINLLLGKIDRENFLGEIKTFFVELQQLSETSTLFDSYLVKTRLPSDFLQRF